MIIAFVGQACLAFALLASILQAVLPDQYLSSRKLFLTLAGGQAFFVSFAFGLLVYAHATDQFALQSVMMHSHTDKPFLYKISGVWGNHEGSMLLWVLIYGADQFQFPSFSGGYM
jgi:cytochrome c-type biogenesis protein CcmF